MPPVPSYTPYPRASATPFPISSPYQQIQQPPPIMPDPRQMYPGAYPAQPQLQMPGYPTPQMQMPQLDYLDFLSQRGQGATSVPSPMSAPPMNPFGGGAAASEGANALFNSAATNSPEAAQAAWNAAATEAGGGLGEMGATEGLGQIGANAAGMGFLPAAGIIAGTALVGKGAKDLFSGKKTKGWEGWGGRIGLGVATGGISELARPFLNHKSTRERQSDVTEDLLSKSDDPTYQAYIRGMREQFNSAPPDPSKPFFNGKYGSFDEYRKAGLDAGDLSGVEGNLRYGEDYAKLSQDQKEAFTQANIDANNYRSSDGGVQMADQKKADEIWEAMKRAGFAAPAAAPSAVPARNTGPAPVPSGNSVMIPKVRKDSPGFKDGKRINYGR